MFKWQQRVLDSLTQDRHGVSHSAVFLTDSRDPKNASSALYSEAGILIWMRKNHACYPGNKVFWSQKYSNTICAGATGGSAIWTCTRHLFLEELFFDLVAIIRVLCSRIPILWKKLLRFCEDFRLKPGFSWAKIMLMRKPRHYPLKRFYSGKEDSLALKLPPKFCVRSKY